jgi:hypothetical protein
MPDRQRRELRILDTERALTVLDSSAASGGPAVRDAIDRAGEWLEKVWPAAMYSPYLVWSVQGAMVMAGRTVPKSELAGYTADALIASSRAGADNLEDLLDAMGTTLLARSLGVDGSDVSLRSLRRAFEARLATVEDPLDVHSVVLGFLSAGGTVDVVRASGVVERLLSLQAASGLFGQPIFVEPSWQATWYAIASLRLAGDSSPVARVEAALDESVGSLGPDNQAELRGWLEVSRVLERRLSSPVSERLTAFAVAGYQVPVDEASVPDWHHAAASLQMLGAPLPATSLVPWDLRNREGRLLGALVIQAPGGASLMDPATVIPRLREAISQRDLSMAELFYFVRAVGSDDLTQTERARLISRLEQFRIPSKPGYAGETGGREDLRATYFGLWLESAIGAGS